MTDSSEHRAPPEDPFSIWMRASSDAMGTLARMWFPPPADSHTEKTTGGADALLWIATICFRPSPTNRSTCSASLW